MASREEATVAIAAVDAARNLVDVTGGRPTATASLSLAFGIRVALADPEFAKSIADFTDSTLASANIATSEEMDVPAFLETKALTDEQAVVAAMLLMAGA